MYKQSKKLIISYFKNMFLLHAAEKIDIYIYFMQKAPTYVKALLLITNWLKDLLKYQ